MPVSALPRRGLLRPFASMVWMSLLWLLLAPPTFAQSELATVFGRVTDQSGAVVTGAEVEIRNVETNVSVTRTTNSDGLYSIPSVHPGHYVISIRKPGFKTVSVTDLTLNVQDNVVRNFQLQVGSTSESITVTAESERVNTTDATVSTVVDRHFVENMPLNGRSFQTLISLTPGVVTVPANYNQEGQFSVNGQRPDANYFTVDGVSANVGTSVALGVRQDAAGSVPGYSALGGTNSLVSVDAMQEFRIQTSTFAPEFGRTPGAQVSIITRSGTEDFHGTAFEYFRNDVLDANDWFANANHQPKPQERQNDFGGVLGGPLFGRKTFFFASYEGLRLRLPQAIVTAVPSLALRQGAAATIQPLVNAFPVPNGPDLGGGAAQFTGSFSDPSSIDSGSLRVDHTFNSKLSAFARYSYAPSTVVSRAWQGASNNVLSNPSKLKLRSHSITAGLTQLLSNTITNEVRFNYSRTTARNDIALDNYGGAVAPNPADLFPSFATPADSTFGAFFLGIGVWDYGKLAENLQRQVNVIDNVSIAKGAHQLKFGIDFRRLSPVSQPLQYMLQPDFFGEADVTSGVPTETDLSAAAPSVVLVSTNFSLYGQDTWRTSSRLSLTFGLRWDVNPPYHGGDGTALPALAGTVSNPTTFTLAPPGTHLYKTTYGNVAPRIGMAYQVSQRPRWSSVLRGGFGIFYDLGSGYLGTVSSGAPFFAQSSLFGVPFPPTPDQAAPPPLSLTPPISNFTGADPNLKLPRTYQWNFGVEQSLGDHQSVTATYLGATGRNLLHEEQYYAPNATFGGLVFLTTNASSSDYHALQLQFKRSLAQGLQMLGSYTWAHSIDNASDDSNRAFVASPLGSNGYDPQRDRGPSDFDIRHSASIAISYDLPRANLGSAGSAILNGWAVDTLLLARSAPPVDLIGAFGFAPPLFGNLRPDIVSGQPFYLSGGYPGGKAFNPAAFAPPQGTQGTLGRNALRSFGAWQEDLGLRKTFRLSDKFTIQFRAEAFNLFNHPNFAPPANNISSAFFGRSIQMLNHSLGGGGISGGASPLYQIGGPRSGQLALKFQF